MKKAPGWKTLGTAVTAALTLGFGAKDTGQSQQDRPVLTGTPDTYQTDTRKDTTRQDTTDSLEQAHNIADSLEEEIERTDSINAATPSIPYAPGHAESQTLQEQNNTTQDDTKQHTQPSTTQDTIFVDGTSYSEAHDPGDNIKTIQRVENGNAFVDITDAQTGKQLADDYALDIQDNTSLNSEQGRQALQNAGWTPQQTADKRDNITFKQDTSENYTDEASTQAEPKPITFTQQDVDVDSLYDQATTRPFHFEGVDDNHIAQGVTAKTDGEPNQHYIISQATQNPDTRSNQIADNLTDIYGSLLGPIAGAHNDPSEIDSPAEHQAEQWLDESVSKHIAYVNAEDKDKQTITPTVTPDEVNAEFNEYGFISNISIDDNELTDRALASQHPAVLYNTENGEAQPSIYLKGGQEPSTTANGIIRTDAAAPSYENISDETSSLEQAIKGSQRKARFVIDDIRPPGQQDTVYVDTETDPVNAVSVGPDYNTTQGIGGTINVHHGDWEFGVNVNYQDDALDETTMTTGEIRQLGVDYSPVDGVTIPAGSYFAPASQTNKTGESFSVTGQIGRDLTDNITARVGLGATRLTETEKNGQLYVADPSEQVITGENPVQNSVYAGELSNQNATESTTVAPHVEAGLGIDLTDHLRFNAEAGYDGAYKEPHVGGGIEYTIGGN